MSAKALALLSSVIGLVGSIVLAYSLNKVLSEVQSSIEALSASIESVVSGGNIIVFRGLGNRVRSAGRISKWWVRIGILCLITSVVLAVWAIRAA